MKLFVKRGNKQAFHPRLTLESTGFCPAGHWCGTMFHPKAHVGLKTIREAPTVKDAVEFYLSELNRCDHLPLGGE